MPDIKFRIHRQMAERSDDLQAQSAFHIQRAKLIHLLVDTLDLEVKDWDITDKDIKRSHEWDNIVIAFGSAGVFSAAVTAFKIWLDRRKIDDVRIVIKKGKEEEEITLRGATEKDVKSIIRHLRLK